MRPIRWLFLFMLVVGAGAIAIASTRYFGDGPIPPFVLEKEEIPHESIFMMALRVHVVAAVWSLTACVALWSGWLLRKRPRIHRWLGRITAAVILFALVPSGAWLAFTAKGGWPSTVGFLLSGSIVAAATIRAVNRARSGDFVSHRRWNAHVLAQLSVAVTSRALLYPLDRAGFEPERAYIVALWVPVIASAWIAHHLTAPGRKERRIRRYVIALAGFASIVACGVVGLGRSSAMFLAPGRWTDAGSALGAVHDEVLDRLANEDGERGSFSRGARPPSERRTRVTSAAIADVHGEPYVTFSIDERYGRSWTEDAYRGCVYPATGKVFLLGAQSYVGARKRFTRAGADAPPTVCTPGASPRDARAHSGS